MNYYSIFCKDNPDSLEKRRSVRQAHLQRVKELQQAGRLLIAGPILKKDHEDPLTAGIEGSLIVAQFNTIEDAKAWAAADPYVTAQVYVRVTVKPFKKVFPQDSDEHDSY